MADFVCDIVTPQTKLFTHECHMVVAPGEEGELGIMAKHAPLVSTLSAGVVRVYEGDATEPTQRYVLQGGYIQVGKDKAIILADRAVPVESIDKDAVSKGIADAEARLAQLGEEDVNERALLERNLAWLRAEERAAA